MNDEKIIIVGADINDDTYRAVLEASREMGGVRIVPINEIPTDIQERLGGSLISLEKDYEDFHEASQEILENIRDYDLVPDAVNEDLQLKQDISMRNHYKSISPRNSVYRGNIRGSQRR